MPFMEQFIFHGIMDTNIKKGVSIIGVKIFAEDLDERAHKQVKELTTSPLGEGETLRIMPDAHAGAGCVIGTTLTYTDKVCPNIVGVDIGCGMLVVELGKTDIDIIDLDRWITKNVPSGFQVHGEVTDSTNLISRLHCKDQLEKVERLHRSMGTLGGGNHFIELNEDDEGDRYLVIHSGSRNLGKQVADIYQKLAEKTNPHGSLSYLTGGDLTHYLHDMRITQQWASKNRRMIFAIIEDFFKAYGVKPEKTVMWETIHNYVHHEDAVIRKGAIRAGAGEKVLIPLNMRDGSLICVGKGQADWNMSAPHGAGRIMSRRQARKNLKLSDFKREVNHIYTTTATNRTIDEAPMAYKDSKTIMRLIEPAVKIEKHLKPLYNFKATD